METVACAACGFEVAFPTEMEIVTGYCSSCLQIIEEEQDSFLTPEEMIIKYGDRKR